MPVEPPADDGQPRSLGYSMSSASQSLAGKAEGKRHEKNGALARRDRTINSHLSHLGPDARVVNIGCGVVRRFESACPGLYLATDIRHLPNVDFSSDASALPLRDGSVDAVIALEMLEHVPKPAAVLKEIARVLKPGGSVIVSVPSTVPRHDNNDYWRFTAQGLAKLCSGFFDGGEVQVFGGTFEALGHLAQYYMALALHRVGMPSRRLQRAFPAAGYWLDQRSSWSTSSTALHTLAFDLLFIGTVK
jgi:SAM-dependent methyltransferase